MILLTPLIHIIFFLLLVFTPHILLSLSVFGYESSPILLSWLNHLNWPFCNMSRMGPFPTQNNFDCFILNSVLPWPVLHFPGISFNQLQLTPITFHKHPGLTTTDGMCYTLSDLKSLLQLFCHLCLTHESCIEGIIELAC